MKYSNLFLLSLFFLLSFSVNSQNVKPTAKNFSLITIECSKEDKVTKGCSEMKIVRYHFSDGDYVSKELVKVVDSLYVHNNSLYYNRYLVDDQYIIDLNAKKILKKKVGDILGVDDKKVFYWAGFSNYYVFDLETNRLTKLEEPDKWTLATKIIAFRRFKALSPDQTKRVEIDRLSGSLRVYYLDGKSELLGEGFQITKGMGTIAPVYWIDNEHILTQKANGDLIIIGTNKEIRTLFNLPIRNDIAGDPILYRNFEGQLIYKNEDYAAIIDLEKKSYSPYDWHSFGYGFYADIVDKNSSKLKFRYKEIELGVFEAADWKTKTIDNYLATAELPSPMKVIKVWSKEKNKWITINVDWLSDIVGWIED